MNLFAGKRYSDAPPDQRARLNDAYAEGRREERAKVADRAHTDENVRRAYERGRRDERARKHGSPLLTLVVLVAAAAGAAAIALAVNQGSFERGGQVVDQNIAGAQAAAARAGQDVADKTGDALQSAGSHMKGQSQPEQQAQQPQPAPGQSAQDRS